jgi:hypothetical protein
LFFFGPPPPPSHQTTFLTSLLCRAGKACLCKQGGGGWNQKSDSEKAWVQAGLQRDVDLSMFDSLLTNSALVYESQCGGMGVGGCRDSANKYSCAHHVTWSPNKIWRSTSIFNLCMGLFQYIFPRRFFLCTKLSYMEQCCGIQTSKYHNDENKGYLLCTV